MFVAFAMVAFFALCSLAVDFGRVQFCRSQLQAAADAAARYAATGVPISPAEARARAKSVANQTYVDGSTMLLTDSDIALGKWNAATRTFTVLSGPAESTANAVRITAARTSAKGNAVPLMFASLLGMSRIDLSASATCVFVGPNGFVGLAGVDIKNNTFFSDYNSQSTTNPTAADSTGKSSVASNETISGGTNNSVDGTITLGPSGTVSGLAVSGGTTRLPDPIAKPAPPPWAPTSNPGSVPQSYSVSSDTTLPGGTYYFTSLTVTAPLRFSGPTTLLVKGNILLDSTLQPTSLVPEDLKIFQIGPNSFGDNVNGIDIVAVVSAPDADFLAKNVLRFRGAALFNTIVTMNNADFYYDRSLGVGSAMNRVSLVK